MYDGPFDICRLSISCASGRHVPHFVKVKATTLKSLNFVAVHSSWLTHRDPEIHQLVIVAWQS